MPQNQVSRSTAEAFLGALQEPLRALHLGEVAIAPVQSKALEAFCALILKWNASLNVTGARSVEDLVQEHLPDAFVLAHFLSPSEEVVDVGSGGGLPALPLAILRPDLDVQLVEPRAKRVAFLRTAVRELGLERVKVASGRIEDWIAQGFARPLAAVSRATFEPGDWVRIGGGIVKPAGRVFALLNDTWEGDELGGHACLGRHHYALLRGQRRTLAWFAAGGPR